MVGAVRFELTTSWSRTKRATKLRYAPTQPKDHQNAGGRAALQIVSGKDFAARKRAKKELPGFPRHDEIPSWKKSGSWPAWPFFPQPASASRIRQKKSPPSRASPNTTLY